MKLVSVIALVLSAVLVAEALPRDNTGLLEAFAGGRIVGGEPIDISERNFQVAVLTTGLCGGSLYREDIVITAAHCTIDTAPSAITVRAGSNFFGTGGVTSGVSSNLLHPSYTTAQTGFDIAILRLTQPFTLGPTIGLVGLQTTLPGDGVEVVVSGYGTTSSGGPIADRLLFTTKNLHNQEECNTRYLGRITETMLCASADGRDACQGDSGGPLTFNNQLLGVVSWGLGCASAIFPGIYASVPNLLPWILENTQ